MTALCSPVWDASIHGDAYADATIVIHFRTIHERSTIRHEAGHDGIVRTSDLVTAVFTLLQLASPHGEGTEGCTHC